MTDRVPISRAKAGIAVAGLFFLVLVVVLLVNFRQPPPDAQYQDGYAIGQTGHDVWQQDLTAPVSVGNAALTGGQWALLVCTKLENALPDANQPGDWIDGCVDGVQA